MIDNSAINGQISQLFLNYLHVEIPSHDVDLIDGGLLDSLMLVDLLVRLEKEFGIAVVMDELDLEDFRSVERIAAYVHRLSRATDGTSSPSNDQPPESK